MASFILKAIQNFFEAEDEGNNNSEQSVDCIEEDSPEYRSSLVHIMCSIIKANTGYAPRSTNDFKLQMFSVTMQRRHPRTGHVYFERNWWVPVNHPLVAFLENHALFYDPSWRRRGVVTSEWLGRAHVYSDATMMEMFRELYLMFEEEHISLENFLPEEEEAEEEEEVEEAADVVEEEKPFEVTIDLTMGEKKNDDGTKKSK